MQMSYKSWPFKEAERILKSHGRGEALPLAIFETGFGPSGRPHIGTFAEVARTTWVRKAYEELCGGKTKLIAFSDDLDGLRKVPGNLPQQEMLALHLGKPLSDIPDPYGTHESFSGHMIARLKEFLDTFGFDFELRSASQAYRLGEFDKGLEVLLHNVERVLEVILPTLKEENRALWSPFLPKCEKCGRIYTTRVVSYRKSELALDYACDAMFGQINGCGHKGTCSVLGGAVKMGWKVDWALRWFSYGVNYEMYGKDLIPSAELSSEIVRIMGGKTPCGFFYELFLDENGEKISKSKGNGVTMEQWLAYAPVESLAYYIFKEPRTAKKLYFDVIPKVMDEYLDQLRKYPVVIEEKKPDSPLWHIHDRGRVVPGYDCSINFTMVNNLVSALGQPEPALLGQYLDRYDSSAGKHASTVASLVEKGLAYYTDHILPHKQYREPTQLEKKLFAQLLDKLVEPPTAQLDEAGLQGLIFDIAKGQGVEPKEFFSAIYEVLLGQERGPRFGSFARLVGIDRVIALIEERAAFTPHDATSGESRKK
ncbi:MAG: lysine--tRNA ligase [Myxococcota bacterium]|jgi:lysyl-tRNA synthetase class 1|nr:lysine--tRNA ligase [Myxococcota bacterium]